VRTSKETSSPTEPSVVAVAAGAAEVRARTTVSAEAAPIPKATTRMAMARRVLTEAPVRRDNPDRDRDPSDSGKKTRGMM
jgi:hypothetical protein